MSHPSDDTGAIEPKGLSTVRCDECHGMYPIGRVRPVEDDNYVIHDLCRHCVRDLERRFGYAPGELGF